MCSPAQQKDLSLFLGRLEEFEKIEKTWNEKKKKEKKMTRNIKLLDATNNRQTAKARGIGKSEREVLGHSMCICTLVLGVLGIRNQQLVCSAVGQTSNATSSDPENANCACFQCKFKNNVCLAEWNRNEAECVYLPSKRCQKFCPVLSCVRACVRACVPFWAKIERLS